MHRKDDRADPGHLLRRLVSLHENTLTTLEASYEEFRGRGMLPAKLTDDLIKLSKSMNETTLAWTRYQKSEKEWADKQTPEARLEWILDWAVALHRERPDLVMSWAKRLAGKLLATQESSALRSAVRDAEEAHDIDA